MTRNPVFSTTKQNVKFVLHHLPLLPFPLIVLAARTDPTKRPLPPLPGQEEKKMSQEEYFDMLAKQAQVSHFCLQAKQN